MLCPVCQTPNDDTAALCGACANSLSAVPAVPTLAAQTPLQAGAFAIGRVLGQGRFAISYLARDMRRDRFVAIREFFPWQSVRHGLDVQPDGLALETYTAARERFLDEARALARFRHSNIVAVYSNFEENNTAYIVMEYLSGSTLELLVERRGALPEREAIRLIKPASEALEVLHRAGLLHGDVTPNNLLLCQDMKSSAERVVLIDFGFHRALKEPAAGTAKSLLDPALAGTAGYAPPEHDGAAAPLTASADVYGLGATLYFLLTGLVVPAAPQRLQGVGLHPPHSVQPEVSRATSEAVMAALELDAARRPQSVREFWGQLEEGRISQPVPATVEPPTSRVTADPSPQDEGMFAAVTLPPVKAAPSAVPTAAPTAAPAAATDDAGMFAPVMLPGGQTPVQAGDSTAFGTTQGSTSSVTTERPGSFVPHLWALAAGIFVLLGHFAPGLGWAAGAAAIVCGALGCIVARRVAFDSLLGAGLGSWLILRSLLLATPQTTPAPHQTLPAVAALPSQSSLRHPAPPKTAPPQEPRVALNRNDSAEPNTSEEASTTRRVERELPPTRRRERERAATAAGFTDLEDRIMRSETRRPAAARVRKVDRPARATRRARPLRRASRLQIAERRSFTPRRAVRRSTATRRTRSVPEAGLPPSGGDEAGLPPS